MSIDKENVLKAARLASIEVPDSEIEIVTEKMNKIFKMVEELNEVNTDGVEPMTSVVDMQPFIREDKVTDGDIQEDVLLNAPEKTAGFFVVPKVVE